MSTNGREIHAMEKAFGSFQHRHLPVAPAGFQSFKTAGPVRYRGRWPRDALIQMTLDRQIYAIAEYPARDESWGQVNLAVSVRLEGTSELRLFSETLAGNFDPPPGFRAARFVPRKEVQAEPMLTLCRIVWSTRTQPASAAALRFVTDGEPLADGFHSLRSRSADELSQLFTLACNGIIELAWGSNPLLDIRARARQGGCCPQERSN